MGQMLTSSSRQEANFNSYPQHHHFNHHHHALYQRQQLSLQQQQQLRRLRRSTVYKENGIKCPVCSKFVLPDDIECHLVMCLTKPQLSYNDDVLTDAKGECVICLEDLLPGNVIARLPCLCVYHKSCIDQWFSVNRCCPEHPGD